MKQVRWTGKTIKDLSLHKRRQKKWNVGFGFEHIPFILMYILVLYQCYLTIGEPYATALQEAQENGLVPGIVQAKSDTDGLAAQALNEGIVRPDVEPSVLGDEVRVVACHS